jgi:transcription antitermination factor NusG
MHPTWFVLRTAPQRELAVAGRLTAAGHTAQVPLAARWRARWLGRRSRRVDDALGPVVPGYAFVAAPVADWPAVLHLDHVTGVLMAASGGTWCPATVADAELSRLRRTVPRTWRGTPLVPGRTVDVADGPWRGRNVTILSVDEARRVVATEVPMLGAMRQVRIPLDVLAG